MSHRATPSRGLRDRVRERFTGLTLSVLVVASGTIAGQVILLVTSLVTARLFTPAEFGLLATVTAIATPLYVACTGRYDFAVLVEAERQNYVHVARIALTLAAVGSALLALLSFAAGGTVEAGWLRPALFHWWAVPALAFSTAAFQIANQLAVRAQRYTSLAVRSMLFPLVAGGVQVVAGWRDLGGEWLVLGIVVGQLVAFLLLWLPIAHPRDHTDRSPWSWQQMRVLAREHWKFPAFSAPAGLINLLALQLPVLIITGLYGIHDGGQYGLATKLLVVPVALIGQTVGYVYAGEISRRSNESRGPVLPLLRTTTMRLGVAGLIFLGIAVLAAPTVIRVLLGSTWIPAGHFIQVMAISVAAQLVVAPISLTITVARLQGSQLILDIIRIGLVMSCIPAARSWDWAVETTVLALSIATAVGYVMMAALNFWAAHRLDQRAVDHAER